MANINSATGTSKTTAEIREWYENNRVSIENYAKAQDSVRTLRDVTKTVTTRNIQTINKEELKGYFSNLGGNEKNLRKVSRYLYYRSNIYYRLVQWYSGMWDLRCRKVIPQYSLTKDNNANKMLKSFESTIDMLDKMNLQGNMTEVLTNVYVDDVCYAIKFLDDTGMFFYILDPDECIIDGRYSTSDFSFSIDMSKYKSAQRQALIEYVGEPFSSMYNEYLSTGQRWVHCPDEYAACFKFHTDSWDTVIPPFLQTFLQMAGLEDLVDIQAEADALSIYKLLYMPMKVLSGTKESDDFEVSPDIAREYFARLLNAVPDGIAGAMVPSEELKVIDFDSSTDRDINSVEMSQNQILSTAGGGAVINANNITSTAAFEAWLQAETEFAISSLLVQINGFTNRIISYEISNPCKVDHFEVSVYTKNKLADKLLESCQYSYSNRLAYNTLLGISEKETLAMLYFETEVLKLQDRMIYPLQSSFTSSNTEDGYTSELGQGAPVKDSGDLSESGERDRNM